MITAKNIYGTAVFKTVCKIEGSHTDSVQPLVGDDVWEFYEVVS